MKTFIFDILNQCTGTLAGSEAMIHIRLRYTVFGHLMTIKNAYLCRARQLSLNSLKDGRILFTTVTIPQHSAHDTGVCNCYTLASTVIGSSKSRYQRGENPTVFFQGAFSLLLLFFLVVASVLLLFLFSFKQF